MLKWIEWTAASRLMVTIQDFFFKKMYFQASEFNVGKESKGCWNHLSPQSVADRKEAKKERRVVTGRRALGGTKVGA